MPAIKDCEGVQSLHECRNDVSLFVRQSKASLLVIRYEHTLGTPSNIVQRNDKG